MRDEEIGHLGGIQTRPAPDPDEAVDARGAGNVGGLLQRLQGGLDARLVEDDTVDAGGRDHLHNATGQADARDAGIGDHQHAAHAAPRELPAHLGGGTGTDLDRRGLECEDRFVPACLLNARHGSCSPCSPRPALPLAGDATRGSDGRGSGNHAPPVPPDGTEHVVSYSGTVGTRSVLRNTAAETWQYICMRQRDGDPSHSLAARGLSA